MTATFGRQIYLFTTCAVSFVTKKDLVVVVDNINMSLSKINFSHASSDSVM